MERNVPIKKFDDEKRIAFGEVYVPNVIDTQGDFMTPENIEAMAYAFLASGNVNKIDTGHDLVENGSVVVESFIVRKGDPDFIEGSWVLAVHIPDPTLWEQVKKGELNGFSMFGTARRVEKEVQLEIPDNGIVSGETSVSTEDGPHKHNFTVQFDESGQIVNGWTDIVNGHSHKIISESVTEEADNHVHRFNILDVVSVNV